MPARPRATGNNNPNRQVSVAAWNAVIDKLAEVVSVKDPEFGAVGDGVVDDTAAIQAFVAYLQSNKARGHIPKGTYKISAKIDFKDTFGWSIDGDGKAVTTIVQSTDNVPIFDLGVIAQDFMYAFAIRGLGFTYTNSQPAANTSATPIKFSSMGFQGELRNLRFSRGFYGIKVVSGIGGPWGSNWDDLDFTSGLTGGAMDWTGAVNGVPNNTWGRLFVDAANMVGPIFKQIRGYSWTIQSIEIIDGTNVQLLDFQSGTDVWIGAVKLELGDYTATTTFNGNSLIYLPNSHARIEQIYLGGTFMKLNPTNVLYLIGGAVRRVRVGLLTVEPSQAVTNSYIAGTTTGNLAIENIWNGTANAIPYNNNVSSATAEMMTVEHDANMRLSTNKGDANYTVLEGDPQFLSFETALTAARTVSLPVANLFNGRRYRVISNGAVNGSNTLIVAASGNTKATLSQDKGFVDLVWRRHPTAHLGWNVVGYGRIDGVESVRNKTTTRGDVSITLTATDNEFQYFNSALTTARTASLPTTGLYDGLEFTVVKKDASGAGTLTVIDGNSGKNYVIAAATKGFVSYRAIAAGEWIITNAGTYP